MLTDWIGSEGETNKVQLDEEVRQMASSGISMAATETTRVETGKENDWQANMVATDVFRKQDRHPRKEQGKANIAKAVRY